MTPLRQRMLEDMQLRALSPRTQKAYVRAVRQLAAHFRKSPDLVTDEELRQYFLQLTQDRHYARATVTIALCGIKFFIERTLGKTFTSLSLMRPPQTHRLPVVLSREEVWRILPLVRLPAYRVCLITIYACGLRLLEGAPLQVSRVSAAPRRRSRSAPTSINPRHPVAHAKRPRGRGRPRARRHPRRRPLSRLSRRTPRRRRDPPACEAAMTRSRDPRRTDPLASNPRRLTGRVPPRAHRAARPSLSTLARPGASLPTPHPPRHAPIAPAQTHRCHRRLPYTPTLRH
ncbi:MAG: site-specific integrase [Vicinamibacterales bacterium]|nr:site-specific integrase [Vicinamibacterales bacterium]